MELTGTACTEALSKAEERATMFFTVYPTDSYKNRWNPVNASWISSTLPRSATASEMALWYFSLSSGESFS